MLFLLQLSIGIADAPPAHGFSRLTLTVGKKNQYCRTIILLRRYEA